MRYEFSKTQLKRYQKIVHIVSIFCFLIGLIFILLVFNSLNGVSGYLTKVGMIVAHAIFIFVLFDRLHAKPYKNTNDYFFEINEDKFILSHPENKNSGLPLEYNFTIDEVKSIKSRNLEGLEEIILEIYKPKLSVTVKIWGFENMRQISNELQKLINIRDRNNSNN